MPKSLQRDCELQPQTATLSCGLSLLLLIIRTYVGALVCMPVPHCSSIGVNLTRQNQRDHVVRLLAII